MRYTNPYKPQDDSSYINIDKPKGDNSWQKKEKSETM